MARTEPLGLMRLKDPNEAAGLALRLLAGESPFRDMPLGMSAGTMLGSIDRGHYAFARRGAKALGFACWAFADPQDAQTWMDERTPFTPKDTGGPGSAVIIMAMQAVDTSVARFLTKSLRDQELAHIDLCYYYRDYGKDGRGGRAVRLVRPKVRRMARQQM